MRLAVIILICTSLCLQCVVQLGVVKWYEWNKATITEKYCVNKGRPERKCNGKCYLKKQLQKTGKEQSKEKNSSSQQTNWVAFIVPERFSMQQVFFYPPGKVPGIYSRLYAYIPFSPIFHPPRV
jgi:hypothetical protein